MLTKKGSKQAWQEAASKEEQQGKGSKKQASKRNNTKSKYSKQKHKQNQNNRKNDKSSNYKRPRHEKLDIKFDTEARKEYLIGLSSRKKERRTFGLAMQKVKDRRARLEDRKESRQALLEQIEDAERSKGLAVRGENIAIDGDDNDNAGDIANANDNADADDNDTEVQKESITTFHDQTTQSQFGGQVIVTTTFNILSDDDSDDEKDDKQAANKTKNVDMEQRYAGSVQKYMAQLKGNLPNKKSTLRDTSRGAGGKKGKHGAENMKGMGSAKDLKMAKRTLDRTKDKQGSGGGQGGGKRGRKGKTRR